MGLPPGDHFASLNRNLIEQEAEYLWPQAQVIPRLQAETALVVSWAKANRATFGKASAVLNIPWWVIAGINNLEMGMNFNGTILNGDSWKAPTKHYPPGLGPWKSWLDACVWGLRHEAKGWNFDLAKWRWTPGSAFYFAECYNGLGTREAIGKDTVPPHASPYIYSGTPFYASGKMVEIETPPGSGKYKSAFDPKLVSDQVGMMAFARALADSGEVLF